MSVFTAYVCGTGSHRFDAANPNFWNGELVSTLASNDQGREFAHWVAVKALDDEGRQRLAFVRRGSPGLRIVDDWSGFGQRTTASGTVLLDQVPVEAELVIDNWRQRDLPNIQGAASQLIQAAIDAGIAEARRVPAGLAEQRVVRRQRHAHHHGFAPARVECGVAFNKRFHGKCQ